MQHAKPKCDGFTTAGFGLGNHVRALEDMRKAGGLDRGHLGKAHAGEVLQHVTTKREGIKLGGAAGGLGHSGGLAKKLVGSVADNAS